MKISYDKSWNSIVISCDECTHWRAIRLDQASAYSAGESHAILVHGSLKDEAENPRRKWQHRNAARHADET